MGEIIGVIIAVGCRCANDILRAINRKTVEYVKVLRVSDESNSCEGDAISTQ